jgi:hypothetical protein
MIWTKLQLQEQGRLDELDLLLKALDGMANLDLEPIVGSRGRPSYPAKEPVEIVTDYLSRLRAYFLDNELNGDHGTIGVSLLRRTPIDIVLTCPIVSKPDPSLVPGALMVSAGMVRLRESENLSGCHSCRV